MLTCFGSGEIHVMAREKVNLIILRRAVQRVPSRSVGSYVWKNAACNVKFVHEVIHVVRRNSVLELAVVVGV